MSPRKSDESALADVRTASSPSDLRITDMRFVNVIGAPMHCILLQLYTNQGLVGFGEVRDAADKTYALMLKSRILGENPCQVDKLFRRIKQFGGHARQGGGVSGVEVALWDLAGKAFGVPVYQMLGGAFRDKVRIYCDTGGTEDDSAQALAAALKRRLAKGFTFAKIDVGIDVLLDTPGALSAPPGFLAEMQQASTTYHRWRRSRQEGDRPAAQRAYDILNTPHPFTGIHVTEKGLDLFEQYVGHIREAVGYEIPLAMDHFGHIGVEDCIKIARRLERFNLAWLEDMIPWQYTDQYVQLSRACATPICTGEDIYLKENFRPLLEKRAVSVIHPDVLTAGGILETKKVADMADEYGVALAIHMAESPIGLLAAAHVAAAAPNLLGVEFHSADCPWWDDLVVGPAKPLIKDGFVTLGDAPGLGIEALNDDVLAQHIHPAVPGLWLSTDEWNDTVAHDRHWS